MIFIVLIGLGSLALGGLAGYALTSFMATIISFVYFLLYIYIARMSRGYDPDEQAAFTYHAFIVNVAMWVVCLEWTKPDWSWIGQIIHYVVRHTFRM